jgi:hypothetical protein
MRIAQFTWVTKEIFLDYLLGCQEKLAIVSWKSFSRHCSAVPLQLAKHSESRGLDSTLSTGAPIGRNWDWRHSLENRGNDSLIILGVAFPLLCRLQAAVTRIFFSSVVELYSRREHDAHARHRGERRTEPGDWHTEETNLPYEKKIY